jgi:hypothetical protein
MRRAPMDRQDCGGARTAAAARLRAEAGEAVGGQEERAAAPALARAQPAHLRQFTASECDSLP